MKTCEYCHYDKEDYITPLDKNGHVFLKPISNGLFVKWYQYKKEIPINFCPMCGRDLHER